MPERPFSDARSGTAATHMIRGKPTPSSAMHVTYARSGRHGRRLSTRQSQAPQSSCHPTHRLRRNPSLRSVPVCPACNCSACLPPARWPLLTQPNWPASVFNSRPGSGSLSLFDYKRDTATPPAISSPARSRPHQSINQFSTSLLDLSSHQCDCVSIRAR